MLTLFLICIIAISSCTGLKCRECKDVDNPKSCPDTIICGVEEICVSREYTNHLGQHSFYLGCESKKTCDILRVAQMLVGKRADSAPPTSVQCHECCDSDDCNIGLCKNALGQSTKPTQSFNTGFITCRECKDVEDPASCSDTIICGYEEICVTSEFTNHLGRHGFRMGCQSKKTCDILKVAQAGFGKRDSSYHDPDAPSSTGLCYQCCESNECNANLCKNSVSNGPVATPSGKGCGDFSTSYGSSCYMIGPGYLNWTMARSYCKSWGGDLLVLNTADEHEFWRKTMIQVNGTVYDRYWIGGEYSMVAKEWEWMDGSTQHYTDWTVYDRYWIGGEYSMVAKEWEWMDGSPQHYTDWFSTSDIHLPPTGDYAAVIMNSAYPKSNFIYKDAPLHYYTSRNAFPFICEKKKPV